jgi:hypothetical protein
VPWVHFLTHRSTPLRPVGILPRNLALSAYHRNGPQVYRRRRSPRVYQLSRASSRSPRKCGDRKVYILSTKASLHVSCVSLQDRQSFLRCTSVCGKSSNASKKFQTTMSGTANSITYTYVYSTGLPFFSCRHHVIVLYTKCTRPPFYTSLPDLHIKYPRPWRRKSIC